MRGHTGWLVAALVSVLGCGAIAAAVFTPTDATVVGTITAAEHELAEGYFTMGEETTLIARPGSDLHRWLVAHRGQKVRLVVTATHDSQGDPTRRPGTGRDSAP
jgi:hypothetical protein